MAVRLRPPSFPRNRVCQNANFEVRKANPLFPSPSVIPAEQGVSKPHPREATAPEIVIPAKAGIQAGWERENAA